MLKTTLACRSAVVRSGCNCPSIFSGGRERCVLIRGNYSAGLSPRFITDSCRAQNTHITDSCKHACLRSFPLLCRSAQVCTSCRISATPSGNHHPGKRPEKTVGVALTTPPGAGSCLVRSGQLYSGPTGVLRGGTPHSLYAQHKTKQSTRP